MKRALSKAKKTEEAAAGTHRKTDKPATEPVWHQIGPSKTAVGKSECSHATILFGLGRGLEPGRTSQRMRGGGLQLADTEAQHEKCGCGTGR